MLVAQKIDKIKFSGENYKESYLQAAKYASSYIKNKEKLAFRYEKDIDKKSVSLIIIFLYDESELASHRCEVCKEFHHSFYVNDEMNCNACKMQAYRKELDNESKRITKLIKEKMHKI